MLSLTIFLNRLPRLTDCWFAQENRQKLSGTQCKEKLKTLQKVRSEMQKLDF